MLDTLLTYSAIGLACVLAQVLIWTLQAKPVERQDICKRSPGYTRGLSKGVLK